MRNELKIEGDNPFKKGDQHGGRHMILIAPILLEFLCLLVSCTETVKQAGNYENGHRE